MQLKRFTNLVNTYVLGYSSRFVYRDSNDTYTTEANIFPYNCTTDFENYCKP